MRGGVCKWNHDEDTDSWDTECGGKFVIIEGRPYENGMKYCPYCGRKLEDERKHWA